MTEFDIPKILESKDYIDSQLKPLKDKLKIFLESPGVRSHASMHDAGILYHPIFLEVLEPDFTQKDILSNWDQLREALLNRFPACLNTGGRRERFIEFLKCQDIGAYVAVCRSVYPEVEALLRDEIILKDTAKMQTLLGKKAYWERQSHLNKHFKKTVKEEALFNKFLGDGNFWTGVPYSTCKFIEALSDVFDSFDPHPINVKENKGKSVRHLHAHGWLKNATFNDGLNAILTLDYAMQLISEIEPKR